MVQAPQGLTTPGLTENRVTQHLVLMGGLSQQRVGEGARGIGKTSQMGASSQGVNQWVNWACRTWGGKESPAGWC